ncbi:probable adenylate kinase 7, mitochondrial [Punica granatum]|uniref:adenylate kinase n=2 Tax=Punica granatum TaxID=22663 RepID=A0A218WMC2_PUNGR|nr:probable adenylate kinase 7, mitochondrial [Punica granatum]OWM74007.1 hypothetical protein CDL15_Pgr022278 [Punica granatum]PKI59253.1 hypothetical protein CRG98_020333 [Punica granatum]
MAGLSRHLSAVASPMRRFGLLPSRAFGSAAAVQCDDYYFDSYSDEEEERGRGPQPRLGTERLVPGRGVQWVIMGDRGANKHLYAERLAKLLEVPHISMGSLVRQELSPRSSLYKQIASAVNESQLVPQDVIFALLSKRLEEGYYRGEAGFILEGLPRTMIQAEILDQIADIDLVLNFKCKEESTSLHKTTLSHRLTPQGEQMISTDLAWKEKFAFYAEQSKLLEDYYNKQKKLLNFHVASGPGETWKGLLAALHLQHMNVVDSSPQKLTA